MLWSDELRNERKKKQSGLGIEDFGENALAKSAGRRGLRCGDGQFGIAREDHSNAEPNEIRGARVLDGVEGDSGSGEDCGDAEGGGEDVEKSANKRAERRKDAFAAASGEAARQHVKDSGAWSDRQEQRGSEE